MKILLATLLLTLSCNIALANQQRSEFLAMVKAAEAGCKTPAKYSDSFAAPDDNHAQLYCLSAFAFKCIGENEKAQLNCATVGQKGDIQKCPACVKSTVQTPE